MQTSHHHTPKSSRRTWRRHLPLWAGPARSSATHQLCGLYLRAGSHLLLITSNEPHRHSKEPRQVTQTGSANK